MKQGWQIKKLGEVCESDLGKTLNQSKDTGELYPYLCAVNILWDKIDFSTVKQTRFEKSELERYSVHKGDLLICEGGDIGRAAIWKKDEPMLYQNALHRVRFNGSIIPRFCLLYLRFLKSIGMLDSQYGKGVTIKHLVKSSLLSIPIPVPPIAEQEKIVAELDCLSGIIEKKKQQLKEYDALAQSIFYEMFGDPVENDKGWDISYLKEIAEFKNGLNFKKVENGRKQLFLGVSNFKDNSIINQIEEYSSINIADDITEEFLLKDNDIVFVRSNGSKELVGRNIIVYTGNEKITYSGFCIRCRIISSVIIPIFLNYMLSVPSIKQVIKNFGRGANISNLNQTMLGQIKVIVPPLTLQQYYISKIEAIEKQKALIKKSIEEVETLFNSRMDLYFN